MSKTTQVVRSYTRRYLREMQRGDFEVLALTMLREAGMGPTEPVCVVRLVRRVVGEGALRFVPDHVLPGNGSLVRVGSEWRIYLRKSAPDHLKRFAALHELGHFVLGAEATEDDCNALAAAVLLPRQVFLEERVKRGQRISAIARNFGTDETCTWLRLGEITGQRVAVISPRKVRARGDVDSWLAPEKLRQIANDPAPFGIRKARLRDDPARLVLRAL